MKCKKFAKIQFPICIPNPWHSLNSPKLVLTNFISQQIGDHMQLLSKVGQLGAPVRCRCRAVTRRERISPSSQEGSCSAPSTQRHPGPGVNREDEKPTEDTNTQRTRTDREGGSDAQALRRAASTRRPRAVEHREAGKEDEASRVHRSRGASRTQCSGKGACGRQPPGVHAEHLGRDAREPKAAAATEEGKGSCGF